MTVAIKKPLLERVAVQYFQRRSSAVKAPDAVDAIHYLNPSERAGLLRVERGAIARAFVAGALSATASALAEIAANPWLPDDTPLVSRAALAYWALLGGVTLAAAVAEILFLYWDTLRSVHELAHVAGLKLFDEGDSSALLVDGLARAALELPNPVVGPFGINAQREASKWRLVAASLAYKAKVGVTNFLVKMLVRRMLGRVFVRSVVSTFVPFVAVPITATWNAVVSWLILREGRIRAMGPSAARALVDVAFGPGDEFPTVSGPGRLCATRAVAAAIVRTQDLHPNLLALLAEVSRRAGPLGHETLDDVGAFLNDLGSVTPNEARVALQVLAVALVLDGRLSRRERRLWREATRAAGVPASFENLERLRRSFVQGDGHTETLLRAMPATPP